ncbi:hypothetical protein PFICI_11151 [Pestalotiopsis fici W106-1]|uniref:Uncharacterized protein n=1 Tax=Pestalotiopsis fici (strain W106-1 / CGMCC3.15140) TaxID=1229662 RepID=W3WVZ7_PESFW|nr:uncharacterized protein PFICI_11151 [Pestalotiopsis fici W106-1]ETS77277.1 hypothetical protein PFICI_11151 [Pestalotiopsis fici W106-1]
MTRLNTAAFNRAIREKEFGKARLILNDWEGSLDEVDWDDATKEGTKMTALSCAAEAGSMELVNSLLERGANVTADIVGRGDGEGPVVKAAKNGHIDVVELLLSRGVNADLASDSPALEWVAKGLDYMYDRATEARSYDMVRLLVSHGARVDNSRGFKLLAEASAKGHLDIVKLMVEKGANVERDNEFVAFTPLSSAAKFGHLDIVKFLVEKGADPNCHDYAFHTPLFLAAEHGHFRIVKFLVEKGADPNGHKHGYGTPLSSAARSGHLEIIEFLIRKGADPNHSSAYGSALSFASQSGHLDVVKLLIEEGANPDASNNHDQTPFSLAAKYGHLEVVKFLAGLGASSDRPDKSGQTPLSLAAEYGHLEVVKFVAGLGASSDRPDNSGMTPLSLAVKSGRFEVVEFLAENGADLKSSAGSISLFLAAEKGYMKILQFLVGKGAILDSVNHDTEQTPLLIAVVKGRMEIVKFLVQRGADPNLIDRSGQTALSIAVENENFEIVEFLVQHRADPNLQVAFEETPLYVAAKSGNAQIAKFLIQNNADPDAICSVERMPLRFTDSADYNEFVQLILDQIHGRVPGGTTRPPEGSLINKYKDIVECMHNGITPSSGYNIHSWLLWGARYGQSAVVDSAINADVQLDICNTHGQTSLSFAAKYGHHDIVHILLDRQARVNSICTSGENHGRTPLSFAAEGGFLSITELLLSKGADPNIKSIGKNWMGQNPLSIAAARGHWEVVRELLSAISPGLDVADAAGRTPLWWATSCGHAITVERILHHGVSVDLQDKDGVTALSISAANGHDEVVRQLIGRSNLSIKDNEGRTALWRALVNGHTEVAQILIKKDDITLHCLVQAKDLTSARVLLENGYDVERVNSEGLTPLRLALCLRDSDFAVLLLKHSASSRNISVKEWVDTFAGNHSDIPELSVLQDGSGQLRLLQDNSSTTPTNAKKTIK